MRKCPLSPGRIRREAQSHRHPDRRPALRRVRRGRPSVHEDAAHRPPRARGALFERAFHTTPICSPNRASILTGQYASRHGIIDNVGARRDEPSAAELSSRAAAAGLRDRAHRQVAHGQRRHAAAGLRPLGQLRRPRQAQRPAAATTTASTSQHTGYITDIMNELAVEFVDAQARQAVLALLRAQGGASGRAAGSRTARSTSRTMRRLRRRRAPPGSLSRRALPDAPERAAARRGDQAEAGVGGGVRAAASARARAASSMPHPRRRAGRDPRSAPR